MTTLVALFYYRIAAIGGLVAYEKVNPVWFYFPTRRRFGFFDGHKTARAAPTTIQNMKKILFAGLIAGLLVACHKDFDTTTVTQTGPIPTVKVQASLYGRVLTTGGTVVSGAEVTVAGQTFTTDAQGLFFVYNQQLDHHGTYIQVKTPYHFSTGRFAYPHLGSSTYVEIVVTQKSYQSFYTDNVASMPLYGGGSVTISAQSLVTADGQIYNGLFTASTCWLDPSDAATFTQMPGDLRAEDADGNARVLKTFGMIGVELITATGEPLNLAPGKKATISLPIPASMQGNAPNTIPLWHFDENNGYWKEEGTATKQGNNYVGEVSHFSFWNCDVPTDYIILNGCLGNAAGDALSNISITLTSANYGTGYGYTDEQGQFGGIVPANEALELKVLDQCGGVVYTTTVGPFAANTTLGKINVPVNNPTAITVSGTLVDCNGAPLTSGLAYIHYNDTLLSIVPTDANGQFQVSFYNCYALSNFIVAAYDAANPLQSIPLTVNVVDGVANAGIIPVCSALDEYVIVQVNGQTNTYYLQPFFYQNLLSAATLDTSIVLLAFRYDPVIGQATIADLRVAYTNSTGHHAYGCEYCPGCLCDPTDTGNLIFTNFPLTMGQYATGMASGYVWDQDNAAMVPYNLSFRLKKT